MYEFDQNESGSVLLLTLFVLLFLATILLGYWQLIRYKTKMIHLKQQNIRYHFAAKSGI